MSQEETTSKDASQLIERAWELAQSIRTCVLITLQSSQPKARPMSAHIVPATNEIWFLAAASADTLEELAANDAVAVVFSDRGNTKFVTFNGTATVSNDRAVIRELWTPFAKAWWDSPEDPQIRAISVDAGAVELWDGPNKTIALLKMATAAVTGAKPKVGDHAKLVL